MSRYKLTYCDKAIAPGCPGHSPVDKWPDCVTEECWHHPDQVTGHVDQVDWFVALIIQDKAETTAAGITIPAGTYLTIRETGAGHIYVTSHDAAESAQADFDAWEAAYGDWCHGEDMRESRITSSTGGIGR